MTLLFFFFFRHQRSIYPYFIYAAIIPFIINIIIDYLYKLDKPRFAVEVFIAVFDSAISAYIVFMTGGFRSPFFLIFLVQLFGVGLLSNVALTLFFLFIDTLFYIVVSDLSILLREGRFIFVNQDITGIIMHVDPVRIDYIVINLSVFAVIVLVLSFVNYRLNIITGRLASNRNKLNFLLAMSDKLRVLTPVEEFIKEVTHTVMHALDYTYNAIVLLNSEKTELHLIVYSSKKGAGSVTNLLGFELTKIRILMSSESNINVKAVKERTTILSHDKWDVLVDALPPVAESTVREIQRAIGTKTFIVVPIIALGEVIGVLEAGSTKPQIQKDDIELLESFASQVGTGIVNNRLYTETLNQKKEIEAHYQEMNNVLSELQVSYTKLENFTAELERSKKKLEEMKGILYHSDKLATIGQVIASITHQFSSPITSISGQAELLVKELNDKGIEAGRERIEKIRLGANKLNELVKKLMLSVRQSKPEFRSINVNDIFSSVAAMWEYELKAANIKLDIKLSGDLPVMEGIPDALEQLLANLISNAKDAMEVGNGVITVSTRLFDKDNIELEVTDEGAGIPDENLESIFTPFFTTKPAGKGTGLGMVIIMNAVEEHNGRLMVRSGLNKGTTFTIILPIKRNNG